MFLDEKECFKSIIDLNSIIDHVFFRVYESSLDLPVKLNHSHFRTMVILNFEGPKPMSVISDKINLEKGSFTTVASTLIDLGFVQKIRDIEDKRVFYLELTNKGHEFAEEFVKNHLAYVNQKLEGLTDDEKNCYFASIQLINNLTKKML